MKINKLHVRKTGFIKVLILSRRLVNYVHLGHWANIQHLTLNRYLEVVVVVILVDKVLQRLGHMLRYVLHKVFEFWGVFARVDVYVNVSERSIHSIHKGRKTASDDPPEVMFLQNRNNEIEGIQGLFDLGRLELFHSHRTTLQHHYVLVRHENVPSGQI